MNIRTQVLPYFPLIGSLMVVATMPFKYGEWQRFSLYCLGLGYLIDYLVNCRWREWRWDWRKIVMLAFCAFFLLPPIWQLFDPVKNVWYQCTVNAFAPFILIGMAGFLGTSDKIRMDWVAWVMLATSTAIVSYLCYRSTLDALQGYDWFFAFNWFRTQHINTHMVVDLYFNLSLILGALVLFDTSHAKWVKGLTAFLMLPIFGALLLTDGRTGLITLAVSMLVLMLYYAWRSKRWWWMVAVSVFCIGTAAFMANNEPIQKAVQTTNPRIGQWKVCGQMIAERPILGYGVCSAREEYVRRVRDDETLRHIYVEPEVETFPQFRQNGEIRYDMMHPHNAIMETWTRFGIIGLLLSLICLIGPMCLQIGKNQIYLTLCAGAFFIQSLFESFGTNLQPLFLVTITVLFYCSYCADTDGATLPSRSPRK